MLCYTHFLDFYYKHITRTGKKSKKKHNSVYIKILINNNVVWSKTLGVCIRYDFNLLK